MVFPIAILIKVIILPIGPRKKHSRGSLHWDDDFFKAIEKKVPGNQGNPGTIILFI
jgi:hypothetical protein